MTTIEDTRIREHAASVLVRHQPRRHDDPTCRECGRPWPCAPRTYGRDTLMGLNEKARTEGIRRLVLQNHGLTGGSSC